MKSDRALRVGDIAYVYKNKPCCGKGRLGFVFEIEAIEKVMGYCLDCLQSDTHWSAKVKGEKKFWIDLSIIKRIPPLSELPSIHTEKQEKVNA